MTGFLTRARSNIPDEHLGAALFKMGSCCFAVMDMFAKLLGDVKGIQVAFIVLVRMIVTAALSILCMRHTGVDSPVLGPPGMRAWLVVRGLLGSVAIFALYSSLNTLQLGEMLSVYFSCPILVSVLAAILLREPYTLLKGICGGISVVGVLLVTQPCFLFGASDVGDPDTVPVDRALGFIQVGIATFLAALIFVLLRFLRGRTNPLFFVSYSGMVGAPVMLVFMVYDEGQRLDGSKIDIAACFYLVGLSTTAFLATYIQNLALELAKAGRVTLLLYVTLPLVVFLSWIVFGDVMSLSAGVGCALIVASAIAIVHSKETKTEEPTCGRDETRRIDGDAEAAYRPVEQEEHEMEKPGSRG